jgi:hypothetical protein
MKGVILRILLLLAEWLSRQEVEREYQRREAEREELRKDPIAWANKHFNGGMQLDSEADNSANETTDNSSSD